MPKSMQEMDADILKYELGLNAVRTSHYPQSQYFIDRCDEIGLLVLTEIPGWQHIGDADWKNQAVKNTEEMVLQYRNHPSIILWGVRINESGDDEEFYLRTNETAHRLDSTRQTGGIRCFRKSQLLEDVYTYNDFIHDGKLPGCASKAEVTSNVEKPYIVTEYGGHMFPTKSFDCEEHRLEHAMRHTRVLDAVASHSDISGSFGWCMADYNTHKDFGSGDRICYHGVLDMFRNHKFAAAVYSSQQDDTPVLEVSSSMDIGEHPACIKGDIWAFTNADALRVYKNGRFIKEYNSSSVKEFKHIKHSPILIDDFIGDAIYNTEGMNPKGAKLVTEIINYIARHGYGKLPVKILLKAARCFLFYGMKYKDILDLYNKHAGDWGGAYRVYRFDAIIDGRVVKTVTKSPMNKAQMDVKVSKTTLIENTSYDVSLIRVSAVDENKNILYFANDPIKVTVDGPLEIIGPDTVSLRGGMAGIYVKTVGKIGSATVTLASDLIGETKIRFDVK
jgi:beta-galactosidase